MAHPRPRRSAGCRPIFHDAAAERSRTGDDLAATVEVLTLVKGDTLDSPWKVLTDLDGSVLRWPRSGFFAPSMRRPLLMDLHHLLAGFSSSGCSSSSLFSAEAPSGIPRPTDDSAREPILAQLRPSGDPDEERDDLSKVLRRRQLYTEVRRLQRILATDESMSATRQIANRLAYRPAPARAPEHP